MTRRIMLLLALVSIILKNVLTLHHEYELSRGRKMWTGSQRAVHYLDHFKLLTQKVSNIKGLMSTNYPFVYETEWSLTFELSKTGQSKSDKDGFALLMSQYDGNIYENEKKDDKNKSLLEVAVR